MGDSSGMYGKEAPYLRHVRREDGGQGGAGLALTHSYFVYLSTFIRTYEDLRVVVGCHGGLPSSSGTRRGYRTLEARPGGSLNFAEHDFPDVGRLCVIVPLCTENRLRFSTRLDNGSPEVRLEREVRI